MQFPVPQFTDVEDRIIGPMTLKQFGIVFGAGMVVVLGYTMTKSLIVAIFLGVIIGLPAVIVAFSKVNGRPMYNTFGYMVKFILSPKFMVFHKESASFRAGARVKDAEVSSAPKAAVQEVQEDPRERLRKVEKLLQQNVSEEKELLEKMH